MAEPIRPAFFGGHPEGATMRVVVNGKPVDVLIAGRDRLRLFSVMIHALDQADRDTIRSTLDAHEAFLKGRTKQEGQA